MRIRVRKKVVRGAGAVVVLVLALVGLWRLGVWLTPRQDDGRPVVLSPSVWRLEAYRRQAKVWMGELREVDRGLEQFLDNDDGGAELYALSDRAEALVAESEAVLKDATYTSAPLTLAALGDDIRAVAEAYRVAALAASEWVASPTADAHSAARSALAEARGMRERLEASPWLTK